MYSRRRAAGLLVLAAVAGSLLGSGTGTPVGHAAGTSVTSAKVSTFRPSALPPACTTWTVVAAADTYVNQQAATTTYASSTTLHINARNGRRARVLLQFTLPAAPSGCTLGSATLRLYNATPTAGRTISVFRAATAWTDSVVTFGTVPAETGTAVNAASGAGWMQWTVTTHVQAQYSGSNFGFLVRDGTEGGTTDFTQVFDSREATNKPELLLTWQ